MIGGNKQEGGAMMEKDYMLAIIMVNYDDNIWDQSLSVDPDLPSGWRTITDSSGTYYWHVATGATQWQHPRQCSQVPNQASPQHDLAEDLSGTRQITPTLGSAATDGENRSSQQVNYSRGHDPDTKVFTVRSLGWVQVPEEDLFPGRSSLTVNNIIQQLSHHKSPEQTDRQTEGQGAWGEGQEMLLVLKKDTLSLMDPLDHTLIHSQPITNIRVWGVGCNNGRDFAFVAGDKDSCVLKCHVFRCDAPARAIATVLHDMCSKILSEKLSIKPPRSLMIESLSPNLPSKVDFLDAVRQQISRFDVQYIGNLPVSRAMGMEVLNRAIESILNATDRSDWEPVTVHVSDSLLSLCREKEGEEPFWLCQMRYLTFLGVGHDSHTFAVITDRGVRGFECHVFWCEPHAGNISEAIQAACMVQYQRCLVAQTPPVRSKRWHAGPSRVKRANSMDSADFLPSPACYHGSGVTKGNSSNRSNAGKKGMLAFFESFRNKQATSN